MTVHILKAAVVPELASEYEACAAGVKQQSERTWSLDDQTPQFAALVVKLKEIRKREFFARVTAPLRNGSAVASCAN